MDDGATVKTTPSVDLSLRWKALIAMTLALVLVNASLALISNFQLTRQFELQQSAVRDQQARQLRALVEEGTQAMSKLASLVPLLGRGESSMTDPDAAIQEALLTNGAMLDLEWDIRSVQWIRPDGTTAIVWPEDAQDIPDALRAELQRTPEQAIAALLCSPECRQYKATPLLWDGTFAGNLVLGRSLADALLAFHALTGAEVAITWRDDARSAELLNPLSSEYLRFPAVTYPDDTLPVLRAAAPMLTSGDTMQEPLLIPHGSGWSEIFRIPALAAGIDALVINDVTTQREAIRTATTGSILLGTLGLILSGSLLLLIIKGPLYRLRDLATVIPLLAENRYADLRRQLPGRSKSLMLRDEIDLMTDTVRSLTDRMELLQYDREQAEARLVWLADHDPLTQLYNRRRFNDDFERILDQTIRFGHQGALLFLDLDQFKDVNDLSGHRVGDTLLQRVSEQLRLVTQTSDLLARLGGDEFALVLPEATEDDALASAESVQEAVCSISLQEHGRRHRVTASIGIVMFPTQGNDIGQLMASADLAMYQAKEKGRGRWYLFSEEDQGKEQLDARVLWREQINQALTQGRFELHVQPIIEIATGRVRHMEVLLRMRDVRGGMVYPDRFIPVAERTGQIQAIDRWVIDNALAAMELRNDLSLSINLSASAMDDPLLLTDLRHLLEKHRIAPERISFEVTETAAINSLLNATRLMRGMQELGCRFALDDFGSGYASYAYLRKLPVDEVKIDGAFVRDIAKNPEDRIFVKAITDMAHGMGKRVIAEFVENAEILAILKGLGVDDAQGYHFSKPVKLEQPGTPIMFDGVL
ncbi:putative bifunctional diguanylate cyclase/phosphodiesterase [Thiocapsa roseopersicina]|uniref:Diguanylate cyclase (GGDEF) domain-containing protein n=1 Tax=Thiocapsa roseopersicina TaxID=1058 RepID=A0A1H2YM97_THIRO|nr:EAL domain-containing protein [Thiocapsa roseopersicina]SDX05938.1 diguanylate cyclase (GGDEF) domain-containing protein [Thiocapsa roseopersicina]